MIQMPEVKLKLLIDAVLDKVKKDYVDATDKATTFLYKCYFGNITGNYDFYKQAIVIFNRTKDDPRTIDTRLLFDRERASLPTIHVTLPSEQPFSDGIGFDEGYVQPTLNSDNETMTDYYNRGYASKFELLITGSNTFEVVMIAYTLKLALINNLMALELNGFRNPKIYTGDVKINEQLAPIAYLRTLTIDSFYDMNVPKFENISIVNNIEFDGKAY
jgi:hypothetical protein